MWFKRTKTASRPAARSTKASSTSPTTSGFGVGAQVIVRLNRTETSWPPQEDPVGVIIAPGFELGTIYWAPPTAGDPSWLIEFETPFYGLDGSGPHTSAKVPERLLELAPLQPDSARVTS